MLTSREQISRSNRSSTLDARSFMNYPKDFLSISELSADQIRDLIALARDLKARQKAGRAEPLLKGKVLAMIFHKPSLRTRVSFETAMIQAGGSACYITEKEIGRGDRE